MKIFYGLLLLLPGMFLVLIVATRKAVQSGFPDCVQMKTSTSCWYLCKDNKAESLPLNNQVSLQHTSPINTGQQLSVPFRREQPNQTFIPIADDGQQYHNEPQDPMSNVTDTSSDERHSDYSQDSSHPEIYSWGILGFYHIVISNILNRDVILHSTSHNILDNVFYSTFLIC